jgi:hypothetical protein
MLVFSTRHAVALNIPVDYPVDLAPQISVSESRATVHPTISNQHEHNIIDVDLFEFEDILPEKNTS